MRYLGFPFLHFSNLLIAVLAIQQTYISSQIYDSHFGLSLYLFIGSSSLLSYHFLQNTKHTLAQSQRAEWLQRNVIFQNTVLFVAAIISAITLLYIPQPILVLPGLLLLLSYKSPFLKKFGLEMRNRGYLKNLWIALTWCYVTQVYPILAFKETLLLQNVVMALSLFMSMSLLYDLPELKMEKRNPARFGAVTFLVISQVCWMGRENFVLWLTYSLVVVSTCLFVLSRERFLGRFKFQYLCDVFLLVQAGLFQMYIYGFQFL